MARRSPRRSRPESSPEEADRIHREMLEHLDRNPPRERRRPSDRERPPARRRAGSSGDPAPPTRPRLMLRRLRLEPALARLEEFCRYHRDRGTEEIVVVVGKGQRSGAEGPVLAPAVREFCTRRTDLVADLRVAPPSEGGEGALVLRLETPAK